MESEFQLEFAALVFQSHSEKMHEMVHGLHKKGVFSPRISPKGGIKSWEKSMERKGDKFLTSRLAWDPLLNRTAVPGLLLFI